MAKFLSNDLERQRILVCLHKAGIWSEELLSPTLFGFITNKILTKKEFFILEEMIKLSNEGFTEIESRNNIAIMSKITKDRVRSYCKSIKRKLRNGMETDPVKALRIRFQNKENPVNGKGDKARPVDRKKFDSEIDRVFGKKCRFSHKHDETCELPEAVKEEVILDNPTDETED